MGWGEQEKDTGAGRKPSGTSAWMVASLLGWRSETISPWMFAPGSGRDQEFFPHSLAPYSSSDYCVPGTPPGSWAASSPYLQELAHQPTIHSRECNAAGAVIEV